MTDQTPLDRFKQALTSASRALANEPEVEVAWSADAPAQSGKNFRVPLPGRNLPRDQAIEARGFADSFALKLRHHNEALHNKGAPPEPIARACYDAVEQVRYEAIGSTRYAGIRDNLNSAVKLRTASDPIVRADEAKDVPLPTALSLMLREALTGEAVPERARAGGDLVREDILAKIGTDMDGLADVLDDQRAFQNLTLDILRDLDLTLPESPEPTDAEDGEKVRLIGHWDSEAEARWIGEEIEAFRRELIAQKAAGDTVPADLAAMRARLSEARPASGGWNLRDGAGRLQDVELFAQSLALRAGSPAREVPAQIAAGQAAGLIDEEGAAVLSETADLMRRVQCVARLLTGGGPLPETPAEGGARLLLREGGCETLDDLRRALDAAAARAEGVIAKALRGVEPGEAR